MIFRRGDSCMGFKNQIPGLVSRVETAIDLWMPNEDIKPFDLHKAMRYSVLGGGKRVRPLLIYATGQSLGMNIDLLDGPAVAVELVHCYSLVHDDLPAMDDDDLRRGRLTTHKAFDEATAILVGDALQMLALDILVKDPAMVADATARLEVIGELTDACGSLGMTGGQAMDLASEGQQLTADELETMHTYKTGKLILASIMMTCASKPGLDDRIKRSLYRFGQCMGLAFQIKDDLLDIEGSTELLGKTQGSDEALNKATYPLLLGIEQARFRTKELQTEALECLAGLGTRANPLRTLVDMIVNRDR